MTSRHFKLTVAYNGREYVGWQVQAQGRTIQAELERAIKQVTQETVRATASGRTDSGVHALGQVVSVPLKKDITPEKLLLALNGNLPSDIRVLDITYAVEDFHAIRDAISKRYRYFIQDGRVHDPFLWERSWFLPQEIDHRAMQKAAKMLVGEHDFATYQSSGSPRLTTVRTIHDFVVTRENGSLTNPIVVEVEANGFLYNMVRNLVGTLVEVGLGKRDKTWPAEILDMKDRKAAGQTAPAKGLFLVSVTYAKDRELRQAIESADKSQMKLDKDLAVHEAKVGGEERVKKLEDEKGELLEEKRESREENLSLMAEIDSLKETV